MMGTRSNDPKDMKILFVCEGNVNRSQMAGTLFKSLVPDSEVTTAGVFPERAGERLENVGRRAIELMKEIGFDMSANVISKLTPEMVGAADKIILMGAIPGGPVPSYLKESPKLETWDVPDPGYGQISFAGARDMVVEHVKQLAARLSTT